jgi:hypothetical protein
MIEESQQDRLRLELKMLHELLEDLDEVGGGTKDAMRQVASDIDRILDEAKTQQDTTEQEWSGIGKRWRDAVLEFESHHPRLTQVVDSVTSILANAGI